MTSAGTFPLRLTKIDALTLPDHSYLTAADTCYFLGEYTARRGFAFSATNDLVLNFKKSVATRGQAQWQYKEQAITRAAAAFKAALNNAWLDVATLVPVPPSKAKNDPLHDDRVLRMLQAICPAPALDIRELIVQTESTASVHDLDQRPRPEEIQARHAIDDALRLPPPTVIGLFDDVLTTGARFRAAHAILQAAFPGVRIIGLFIARRAPESSDVEDFDI